jgi:hypothetical protein
MDLVVAGQQLAFGAHQLGPVDGEALPGRHREAPAQQGHLVAAGHGHQEATAALRQGRCQLQAEFVVTHEGEVLGQPTSSAPRRAATSI